MFCNIKGISNIFKKNTPTKGFFPDGRLVIKPMLFLLYWNPYFLKMFAVRRSIINLHIRPDCFVIAGGRKPFAVCTIEKRRNFQPNTIVFIASEYCPCSFWNLRYFEAIRIAVRIL